MMIQNQKKALSVYIHIPFCIKRCGYCDFNTYAGMNEYIPSYLDTLEREIEHFSDFLQDTHLVKTIYFGGGTPSLITAKDVGRLIDKVSGYFQTGSEIEVSLEANPNGLSRSYLASIRNSGVNRISIGMQSAISGELKILDRRHAYLDVQKAVENARQVGFCNINLDLMFGIPEQSMTSLKQSVDQAIDLQPEHLSLYGLDLHEGTPLQKQIAEGDVKALDDDLAGEMYAWLMEYLPTRGYLQYEISNWSMGREFECRHNLQYWRNLDYLGIGAGAHSFIGAKRWNNLNGIWDYIRKLNDEGNGGLFHPAVAEKVDLDQTDIVKETMMMGLRLTNEGIGFRTFKERFQTSLELFFQDEINRLAQKGLLEVVGESENRCLRLTQTGRMLGNQVFLEFI